MGCANRAYPTVLLDLALVNAAMHDAIQAIEKHYKPYLATPAANGTESRAAGAACAGHRVPRRIPGWTPFISSSHFPAGSQNPAYPDYVSGANSLTGAATTTLQLFFGTDWVPFEIYKAPPASVAICTNPRAGGTADTRPSAR